VKPKRYIVCLQELKCETQDFPEADLRRADYSAVWDGRKSWNGVAILSHDLYRSLQAGNFPAIRLIARPDISKPPSTAC
jgi:exonuclease III